MKLFPTTENMYQFVLFWTFLGLVFFQVLYVCLFFGRLAFRKLRPQKTEFPPVSIVICARNEADNLYEKLPKILLQNYPAPFEVIVVNNQSMDDSKHLLYAMQRESKHLVIVEMERSKHIRPSKKLPLTLGIKKAQYNHLLLTDADCLPDSNEWIQSMAGCFSEKKQLVLGYSPYTKQKGFLNKVIRFDTTMIAVNYFSMAINRIPYMGVGRNLAYTKTLFDSVDGFKSHYSIPSGDDDLFVQEAAKKNNYAIQLDPKSFVETDPKETWEDFITQKARHYTTSPKYSFIKKVMLGIYPTTSLLLLISFITLLLEVEWRWHAAAGLVLVILLKWWFLGKCFSRLKSSSFIGLLPFLDLLYVICLPFFYYSIMQKKRSTWK